MQALRRLDRATARCDVWEVDDAEALLLLATLNRLQGQDDPHKRAVLVGALAARRGMTLPQLSRELPDRGDQLKALAGLGERVQLACPRPLADQRVAVHFFLLPADRSELEEAISAAGGPREQVLMRWARGER